MPSDTSPHIERLMAEIDRRLPFDRKIGQVDEAFGFARRLHAAGHRLRHPDAGSQEIQKAWAISTLGNGPWIDRMKFDAMTQPVENIRAVKHAVRVLDDLGIRYAIGGSLASSLHGRPRMTQDADIAVEPFPGKERLFAMRFPAEEYYADEAMIRDAIARRATFNILDLRTSFKLDFFVQKDRPFDREILSRRVMAKLFDDADEYGVVAAEDCVLLKLECYRLGNEVSDHQWNDVLSVLRTQAGQLDSAHLDQWASALGVKDLLDRARAAI